jgi:predicted nucleic acid-binding protein
MSKFSSVEGGKYIVDSNILLKWILPDEKKTLTKNQKELLSCLFKKARLHVTPQVLAEVSNILQRENMNLGYLREKHPEYFKIFCEIVEEYIPKDSILLHERIELGVTDISLLELSKKKSVTLITDDSELVSFCKSNQILAHTLFEVAHAIP